MCVQGLPLPSCQSVVPVSSSFFKEDIDCANAILFAETRYLIFSTIAFQYMQVMYQNTIFFTVKRDELMQIIYVVCYHANKK